MNTIDEKNFSRCFVCNADKVAEILSDEQSNCPRCGSFKIRRDCFDDNREQIAKNSFLISYYLRNHSPDILSSKLLKEILEGYDFPKPRDQIKNAILFLGKETKYLGGKFSENSLVRSLSSIIGVASIPNYNRVFSELLEQNLIQRNPNGNDQWFIELTMKGWNEYEKISQFESKKAFMAMRFQKEGDSNDKENFLYQLYPQIKEAVKAAGFDLYKMDDVTHSGDITKRMEVEIMSSAFVVADLTHGNQGAYWESGFARGKGKKVIHICRDIDIKNAHFDLRQYNILAWRDDGENKDFLESLTAVIRAEFFDK